MGLLVVPLPRRCGLPMGDNSLQPEALCFQENLDKLLRKEIGNFRKKAFDGHSRPFQKEFPKF
jgi:hypothetical protein